MEHFHPRTPIEAVLSTLAFYGRERNQEPRLPIPDLISINYLIQAAVSVYQQQPNPQVPHGHGAAVQQEVQLYRDALDFALQLEMEIDRPMFG